MFYSSEYVFCIFLISIFFAFPISKTRFLKYTFYSFHFLHVICSKQSTWNMVLESKANKNTLFLCLLRHITQHRSFSFVAYIIKNFEYSFSQIRQNINGPQTKAFCFNTLLRTCKFDIKGM